MPFLSFSMEVKCRLPPTCATGIFFDFLRGIRVAILYPTDERYAQQKMRVSEFCCESSPRYTHNEENLLAAGVRIFEYKDGVLRIQSLTAAKPGPVGSFFR
jgi:hypothetical protein